MLRFISFVFACYGMELMVISPWAETVWQSGQEAVISYEIKPGKPDLKMDSISAELMSGDPLDGLTVCVIASDIPTTSTNVAWKVPDFPMNSDYFIRIGSGDNWFFSHTFTIQGTGKTPLPAKPTPVLEDKAFYTSSDDTVTPNKAKIESNTTTEMGTNTTSSSASPKSASKTSSAASLVPGSALLLLTALVL